MSTLSDLKSLVGRKLGTQTSNIFNADKKTYALNKAREFILSNYYVDDFVFTDTVTFTAGKAAVPTLYLRWVKMFDSSNNAYTRVHPNKFDDEISRTWTIKDDAGTRKIYVYPTDTTTLSLRYIKRPADMASDSTETGFTAFWDNALATMAASILLLDDQQWDAGNLKEREAIKLIGKALQTQEGDMNSDNAVHSLLEDNNFLSTNASDV